MLTAYPKPEVRPAGTLPTGRFAFPGRMPWDAGVPPPHPSLAPGRVLPPVRQMRRAKAREIGSGLVAEGCNRQPELQASATGESGMPRLTITEIAARVGVHKSTVSRQVRRAGLVGPDGRVDLVAYEELRSGALDPALQTTGRAPAEPEGDAPQIAIERARKMAADAAMAEIELAKKRGELIEAAAAEAEYEDLFRRLRDRLLAVPQEVAGDCARLADEVAIEGRIAQALKAALRDFAGGLKESGNAVGGAA